MKKNFFRLLAVCLIFGLMSGEVFAANGFDDVLENDWFFSGVEYVNCKQNLAGRDGDCF